MSEITIKLDEFWQYLFIFVIHLQLLIVIMLGVQVYFQKRLLTAKKKLYRQQRSLMEQIERFSSDLAKGNE